MKWFFATSLGVYKQQQEQNKKMLEALNQIAENIVASIRRGKITDSEEFVFMSDPTVEEVGKYSLDKFISMIGGLITSLINEKLNDEKMSFHLKANYQFMAMIKGKTSHCMTISCGFLSNTQKKEIKKMAKESNGRITMNSICEFCSEISPHLQKCGACRSVSYCCKEHQAEDWKEHKKECKHLAESKQ